MYCLRCRRKIGIVRRLFDREYCSDRHRKLGRLASALDVRDSLLYGDDELWEPEVETYYSQKKPTKKETPVGAGAFLLLCVSALAVLWFLPSTGGSGAALVARPAIPPSVSSTFSRMIPSLPQLSRQDFRRNSGEWIGEKGSTSSAWSFFGGVARPGKLQIWKPSALLTDYQFEFEGAIERKALSWAFRATDVNNFYASKIVVLKPNQPMGAGLVRFVMLDGRESDRVELPIPVPLTKDLAYQIKVNVHGNAFRTYVNGQIVDSWRDDRFRAGGIGFFSDQGEAAAVKWVSVSDRSSFLGRLLAFSFLVDPSLTATAGR
ncbi:MAG: hypothetical protein ACK5AZ_16850 [Bryobacteraceae bacterium]